MNRKISVLVEVDLEPVSAVDVEPVVLTTWAEGYAEPVPDPNPSTRTAALRFPPSYVGGSVTSETPPDGTTVFAVRPTDAWPSFSATVVADGATSGSYEFANAFDPGAYQFVVVPLTTSGLPARWVGGGADRSTAATYHVIGDGNSIDLPAVELVPGGVIAGTVTDGSAGIPDVEVRAFGLGERWVPRAVARTDADGTYRLPAMPDGTYEIAFVPAAGTSAAQQWYDGAATRSAAEPVVIAGNQGVVSVDAVLDASGSATGTVTGPDGGPVAGVRVVAFADTDTWVGTAESLTAADGTYELVAPAGSYRLRFVPPAASGFASTWLTGQSRWTSPPVAIRADEPAIGVDQELGRT